MKVPVANVFVGFGTDILEKLMKDSYSYKNLIQDLEKSPEAGFLFSTANNPNFISFEHQYGYGGSSPSIFVLKFIDPKREFETRFISHDIIESIIDKNAMSLINELTDRNTKTTKQTSDVVYDITYAEYLEKSIREEPNRKLFISYGIGQNLRDWSGPWAVHVMNGKVEYDGSKVITLNLVPTNANLDSNQLRDSRGNVPNQNFSAKTRLVLGYSQPISYLDENFITSREYKLFGDPNDIDFHRIIINTIKDFVRKAGQIDNVVALFPDINKLCRGFITSIIEQESSKVTDSTVLRAGGVFGNTISPVFLANVDMNIYQNYLTNLRILKRVLAEFGIDLIAQDVNSNTIPIAIRSFYNITANILPNSNLARLNLYINNYKHRARISCNLNEQRDPLKVIEDIIIKINKKNDKKKIVFDYHVETNLRILKYWKTKGENSFTFESGNRGAGQYNFSDNEVHILGDERFINNYLYPMKDSTEIPQESSPIYIKDTVLLNQIYIKTMNNILKRSNEEFFKQSYLPDDFALAYTDEQFQKGISEIYKRDYPVFRYNFKNPNVMSMTFHNSELYFTLLTSKAEKFMTTRATKGARKKQLDVMKKVKIQNYEQLYFYIKSHMLLNNAEELKTENIVNTIDPSYKKSFEDKTSQTMAQVVEGLVNAIRSRNNLTTTVVDQFLNSDERLIFYDFLQDISTRAFQVELNTLPMFSICNIGDLGKPCLLLCQAMDIVQTKKTSIRNKLNLLGTGVYQISRFKHIINANECKSLFTLVKTNLAEGLDKLPTLPKQESEDPNNKKEEDEDE